MIKPPLSAPRRCLVPVCLSDGPDAFAGLGAALYEQAAAFYADSARRVLQAHAERPAPLLEANTRTAFKASTPSSFYVFPALGPDLDRSLLAVAAVGLGGRLKETAEVSVASMQSGRSSQPVYPLHPVSLSIASPPSCGRPYNRRRRWRSSARTGSRPRACTQPPTRSCSGWRPMARRRCSATSRSPPALSSSTSRRASLSCCS